MKEQGLSTRASDADRERVVGLLQGHLVAGRLDAHEFEERIERAYEAATLEALQALTTDLPESRATAVPAARRRPMLPGNRPFAVRFHSEKPPAVVISEAMRTLAPNLTAARYRLERSEPTRLVFRREHLPFWAIAVAIFVPLFGLIALVAAGRVASEIVVSATDLGPKRTVVDVFGVASGRARRAMLELDR
jgi:hypothetical protein